MKKLIIIIVIVIIALIAWTLLKPKQTTAPGDNTAGSVERELSAIDLGNLDSDFQAIDKDLQAL